MHTVISRLNDNYSDNRLLYWAFLFSLIVHLVLFLVMYSGEWLNMSFFEKDQKQYEEVEIIFPENKPRQIVQNINENELMPEDSDLLSDKNSRARNEQLLQQTGIQPMSEGNVPFANLNQPEPQPGETVYRSSSKKFSRDALTGKHDSRPISESARQEAAQAYSANNIQQNIQDQQKFSADAVGNISLSTYAWEWAPYINQFRDKLLRVWYAPPAYYQLGLIHGYSVVRIEINRLGEIINMEVLKHIGHESLQVASTGAVEAVFPFRPLPDNFPEETLTLTLTMIYPNLRERRN